MSLRDLISLEQYHAMLDKGQIPKTSGKKRRRSQSPKAKQHITKVLLAHKIEFVQEFKFARKEGRQFRFDYYIPSLRLGIEYEGLMSDKSRHTTALGYSGDTSKYNMATLLGYKVLRYTTINYTEFEKDLNQLLNNT